MDEKVWDGVCSPLELGSAHLCPVGAWLLPQGCTGKRKKVFSVMISSAFPLPPAVTSAGPAQLLSSLSLTPLYPSSCLLF